MSTAATPGHHLAQFNIARLLEPLDTPRLAGFVEALEPINALAEGSPGFVWRLQTDEGDATSIRIYDDDMVLLNLSVWTSPDELADFAYRSAHNDVLRQRRQWFEKMDAPVTVLWWVSAGHRPSPEEARSRLEHLQRHGPTPDAFTFRMTFPAPSGSPAS